MRSQSGVVIAGSLAHRPFYGGHTWVLLQYLLGFRDLGWDVLFIDRLDEEMSVNKSGLPCPAEDSVNWSYLQAVMHDSGLDGSYALVAGERWLGLPLPDVLRRVRESALLINVMGFMDHPDVLEAASVKVFLDIDPGFGQMWKEQGLDDIFGVHDCYLTVGANIGKPGCAIPRAGIEWHPTPPPVVLRHWPVAGPGQGAFTSIGSWRGPFGPVDYQGRSFGLRVHEFRKFFALPALTKQRFRAAIEIDPADRQDVELLHSNGWELEDPRTAAGDPRSYRRYIQGSKAEFLVAKGMYVETCSGWISDRSVCFLASGKPVLAQETGLSDNYPTGEGLVTFSDLHEASDGAARICADYPAHARRARELAEGYFDSRKVLTSLVDLVGVS